MRALHAEQEMPKKVNIIEVGPRDGFQNVKTFIPTEEKKAIIKAFLKAGVKAMEVTSFVNPKAITQMADAKEIVQFVAHETKDVSEDAFTPYVLIPNKRGAQTAAEEGVTYVSYIISVSETHNMNNTRRTVDESFQELAQIVDEFPQLNVRVDAVTLFGCPFEGFHSDEKIKAYMDRLVPLGIKEVVLCDTIGVANPLQVRHLIRWLKATYPQIHFVCHFHDTHGMGLANCLSALQEGIDTLEVSGGGLGGCPFAPGATGNTATEDLLYMLHEMGIETGINLKEYMKGVALIKSHVDGIMHSHLWSVEHPTCKE